MRRLAKDLRRAEIDGQVGNERPGEEGRSW